MPQIMESYIRQAGPFQDRLKVLVNQERARLHDEGYALIISQNAAAAAHPQAAGGRVEIALGEYKANLLAWA